MSTPTHFINIMDFSAEYLAERIEAAIREKDEFRRGRLEPVLAGKTLAMYFEKPSLRTRMSFEVAMTQLGGHAIYLTEGEVGLGKREPVKDVARVISGMCAGIVARTFSHEAVLELARHASVPVINALTDYSHPCQVMGDLMTVREKLGRIAGLKLAYVGDGNNVARSLACACAKLGAEFVLASPPRYRLEDEFVAALRRAVPSARFSQTADPASAVAAADVVYTDTWVSMGQEKDKHQKVRDFQGYQVDMALVRRAKPTAVVMHCLPAYRGNEITDEVMECPQSVVFEEAENRLHFQRSLLACLLR